MTFKKGHKINVGRKGYWKGKKRTEDFIIGARKRMKENNPMHKPKIKEKYLKSMKENVWNNKERNKKISLSKIGKKHSKETKRKIKLARAKQIIIHSEEGKKRMSETRKKLFKEGKIKPTRYWLGKKFSKKYKEKLRLAKIKYLERCKTLGQPLSPTIGKNETRILDELQKTYQYKIKRQKRIIGYFVDGYILELNLVIEINEKEHYINRDWERGILNNKTRQRQKDIEGEGYNFLEINEQKYLKQIK